VLLHPPQLLPLRPSEQPVQLVPEPRLGISGGEDTSTDTADTRQVEVADGEGEDALLRARGHGRQGAG
jgi:hypothetical protein